MKHAFLIIAHDNFSVLERLLTALSHPEVDIYLHLDAKVKSIPPFDTGNANLHILAHRVDTRWGDFSQIETEYALLEEALRHGGYGYYHILSGTHFPLIPINEILHFFDKMEGKIVFHDLCVSTTRQERLKLRSFNILTKHLGYGAKPLRRFCQIFNRIGHQLQDFLRIERNKGMSFHKASNWASFPEDAVRLLIDSKPLVKRVFKYTYCGDEYFAPTVLMHSKLKDKVLNYDKYLKIEMGEANPRVLTTDDYDSIISSGCLFARKFDDRYLDILDLIQSYSSKQQQV